MPGATVPSQSSAKSRQAKSRPPGTSAGSSPFSKRLLASLRMPVCISVRRMLGPLKLAASRTTSVVVSSTSASTEPNTPAITRGFSTSAITSIWPSSVRSTSSSVTILSPLFARRAMSVPPQILPASKACRGCPQPSIT